METSEVNTEIPSGMEKGKSSGSSTGCSVGAAGSPGSGRRDGRGRWVAGGDWRRFWALVELDPRTGCWIWTGRRTADGYPLFDVRSDGRTRPVRAHRWAWEHTYGPLDPGLTLDHRVGDGPCTSTLCVRPTASAVGFHLEPVTNAENVRRRHARTRSTR